MLPLLLPTHSKKHEAAGTPAEAIVLPLPDYIQGWLQSLSSDIPPKRPVQWRAAAGQLNDAIHRLTFRSERYL